LTHATLAGAPADLAADLGDPDADLGEPGAGQNASANDSARVTVDMLHGIASRCPAFEGAEWFDVEKTLSSQKHVVAVAPSGAVMCTCMHTFRVGMPCRHIVACLPKVRVIAATAVSDGTHSSADDSANAVLTGAGAATLANQTR
jgi:hypothetical protein